MKLSFFAAVLLLISAKIAVAGPKQYTTQQITQAPGSVLSLKGPSQTTSTEIGLHGHLNATRSLRSLFRRDPDFEFAMGILARNTKAANETVDQIIADIKHGTVDPQIEQAAIATKLIVKNPSPKARRFLGLDSRTVASKSVIKGPQGQPHAPGKVAQHIMSGGRIPEKIIAALIASKNYLRPGQTPKNPTAPPNGKPGKAPASPTAPPKSMPRQKDQAFPLGQKLLGRDPNARFISSVGRKCPSFLKGGSPFHYYHDPAHHSNKSPMSDELHTGVYVPDNPISTRNLKGLRSRDHYGLFVRAAEAGVTHEELQALVQATQKNPKAEQAVYRALTMDPNVEEVTEDLIRDWVSSEDLGKRDTYADVSLETREAEAEPEADADAEAEVDPLFSGEWEA